MKTSDCLKCTGSGSKTGSCVELLSFKGIAESMNRFSTKPCKTDVPCPDCHQMELLVHYSCLNTLFSCPHCKNAYSLAQLARRCDETQFSKLESVVCERLSDRL